MPVIKAQAPAAAQPLFDASRCTHENSFKRRMKWWLHHCHPSNRIRFRGQHTVLVMARSIRHTRFHVSGQGHTIVIEPGVSLRHLHIDIRGDNHLLHIQRGCQVGGRIELHGRGSRIQIGEKSQINDAFLCCHWGRRINIGEACLFSSKIDIRTTDSHSILDTEGQRINPDEDVHIGERVWVGNGAMILKGTQIDNDVVIGARSLVGGHIPAYSLAVGSPAKVVKSIARWDKSSHL